MKVIYNNVEFFVPEKSSVQDIIEIRNLIHRYDTQTPFTAVMIPTAHYLVLRGHVPVEGLPGERWNPGGYSFEAFKNSIIDYFEHGWPNWNKHKEKE